MAGTSEGAKKAAETKGPQGRSEAAQKAAETRSRENNLSHGKKSSGHSQSRKQEDERNKRK